MHSPRRQRSHLWQSTLQRFRRKCSKKRTKHVHTHTDRDRLTQSQSIEQHAHAYTNIAKRRQLHIKTYIHTDVHEIVVQQKSH